LFEDNAEFGFGMRIATKYRRQTALENLKNLLTLNISEPLKNAINELVTN